MSRRQGLGAMLASALLALAATGCLLEEEGLPTNSFQVSNRLERDIELEPIAVDQNMVLRYLGAGSDGEGMVLPAGEVEYFAMDAGTCPAKGMRALDAATGAIVAVSDDPVCGGQRWIIEVDEHERARQARR